MPPHFFFFLSPVQVGESRCLCQGAGVHYTCVRYRVSIKFTSSVPTRHKLMASQLPSLCKSLSRSFLFRTSGRPRLLLSCPNVDRTSRTIDSTDDARRYLFGANAKSRVYYGSSFTPFGKLSRYTRPRPFQTLSSVGVA